MQSGHLHPPQVRCKRMSGGQDPLIRWLSADKHLYAIFIFVSYSLYPACL